MTNTLPHKIIIPIKEICFSSIRAQGAGGQHVNKVASAIHLRFDIRKSSLADAIKQRLLTLKDNRINQDGIIIIKAQQFRSLEKNKNDAVNRLNQLINQALPPRKTRKTTKPSYNSIEKRLKNKINRSRTKKLRNKIID